MNNKLAGGGNTKQDESAVNLGFGLRRRDLLAIRQPNKSERVSGRASVTAVSSMKFGATTRECFISTITYLYYLQGDNRSLVPLSEDNRHS